MLNYFKENIELIQLHLFILASETSFEVWTSTQNEL